MKKTIKYTLGTRIKYLRKKRSLTQKELGQACGFPEHDADVRIRQYESDKRHPKEDVLSKMAEKLQVDKTLISANLASLEETLEIHLLWADLLGISTTTSLSSSRSVKDKYIFSEE